MTRSCHVAIFELSPPTIASTPIFQEFLPRFWRFFYPNATATLAHHQQVSVQPPTTRPTQPWPPTGELTTQTLQEHWCRPATAFCSPSYHHCCHFQRLFPMQVSHLWSGWTPRSTACLKTEHLRPLLATVKVSFATGDSHTPESDTPNFQPYSSQPSDRHRWSPPPSHYPSSSLSNATSGSLHCAAFGIFQR